MILFFATLVLQTNALGEAITLQSSTPPTQVFGPNKVNFLPGFTNYNLESGDFSQWTVEHNPTKPPSVLEVRNDSNAHGGKSAYFNELTHGVRMVTPQFTPKKGIFVEARFYNPTGLSSCQLTVYQPNLNAFVDLSTNRLEFYENNSADQYVTMILDLSGYAGQTIRVGVAGGRCQVDYVAVYEADPPPFVKIAAGGDHNVGIRADGTLWAWGSNAYGQLGLGDTTDRHRPVQVGAHDDWVAVDSAHSGLFSIAMRSNGTIWTWGRNDSGQLGMGDTIDRATPTQVGVNNNWAGIACGANFAMALRSNGTLWSWGANSDSQLGVGDTANRTLPTQVGVSNEWKTIACGSLHGLGLRNNGTLWTWGLNNFAQLGVGDNTSNRHSPVQIGSGTNWKAIDGGDEHSLGIRDDGTLWVWGRNRYGQLGLPNTTLLRYVPEQLGADTNWTAISCGRHHSAALRNTGTLWSWGLNSSGHLGLGDSTDRLSPTQVGTASTWIKVACGAYHMLAMRSEGTLWSWGNNSNGRLGLGDTTNRSVPSQVQNVLPQVISFPSITNKIATDTVVLSATGGNSGNPVTFAVTDGPGIITGGNSLSFTASGSVTITASQNGNEFYESAPAVARTFTVSKATAEITLLNLSQTYTGGVRAVSATTVPNGLTYGVMYDDSSSPPINAGSYTVTSSINDPKYQGSATATLVVAKATQAITFAVTPDQLTTASVILTATGGGSGNAVTFAVTGGPGLISSNTLTFTTSGAVSVTATQAGNTNYFDADVVTRIFSVTKAMAPLALNGLYQAFNGQPRSVTATSVPANLQIELSYNGEESSPTNPGSYTVQATVSDLMYQGSASAELVVVSVSGGAGGVIASGGMETAEGNGTDFGSELLGTGVSVRPFTINNPGGGSLTLTGNPLVEIEGEHANDFQVTQPPQPVVIGQSGRAFEIRFSPAGPGTRNARVRIASSSLSGGAYSFAISGFGRLAKLQPQTISFNPPTVASMSEGNLLLRAASSAGLPVAFRVVSGPAVLSGNLLQFSNSGMVKVEASQPGQGNVAPARPVVRSIRVQAASSSLTLGGLSHVYDGTPKSVSVFGAAGPVTVSYRVNGIDTATPPVFAGRYTVRVSDDLHTRVGTLVIEKAPLRVLPDNQRRFVGQANPGLTFTFEGWIGSDNAATTLLSPLSISTSARQSSPAGVYPITTKGGSAINYQLIHVPGTLFIQGFNGSYEALLNDPASGLPTGKLTLTIPAANRSFTGKLHLAEQTVPLSLKGEQVINPGDATSILLSSVTRGATTYRVEAKLSLFGELTAQLFRGEEVIGEASDGAAMLVLGKNESVEYAGRYTAVLEPPQPEGAQVPVGAGWATGTVTRLGQLTLRGKLADGTAFTASLPASQGMHPGYRMFAQPYNPKRTATFASGSFALIPNPARPGTYYLPEAEITWTKAPRLLDSTYRSGFGPVTTMLGIDCWVAPTSVVPLSSLLGLPNSQVMVQHSDTGSAAGSVLPTRVVLGDNGRFQVIEPITAPLNVRKWQANLQRGTGMFSGSFELIDPTQKRSVPFSGVMRQTSGSDDLIGAGQFLLPPLRGGVTTEKQTGAVFFRRPVPAD